MEVAMVHNEQKETTSIFLYDKGIFNKKSRFQQDKTRQHYLYTQRYLI